MTRAQGNLAKRNKIAAEKKEALYKKYKIKEGGAFSRDEKLALAQKNAQRKADPKAYAKRKAAHEASAEKKRLDSAKTKHDDFQKKHKRGKYSDKAVAKAAEKEKTRKSNLNIFQRIGEGLTPGKNHPSRRSGQGRRRR